MSQETKQSNNLNPLISDRQLLGQAIYQTANIKGQFKLRSGTIATEYFDKYLFESRPEILAAIANQLIPLLPVEYDYLAGLEMGGIPIATALSLSCQRQVLFVRKEAKTYGTCRQAEGGEIAGTHLVIIEDVVTTGGAILDMGRALRDQGAIIHKVICVIDRESGGTENLAQEGLVLTPLFKKSELEAIATASIT